MKSKHSGMLSNLYLLLTFGLFRWNLNTVECWVIKIIVVINYAIAMKSKHSGMLSILN